MRVPIDWLKEYVDISESRDALETLADDLTMAGLEVEEILEEDGQPVFLTKITPNRGDWASVYGTAREIAAMDATHTLKPQPAGLAPGGNPGVTVRIDDGDNCHRFMATVIRGVTIGTTPEWLQARLRAALGERYRMINNVADITNYVMLELGQPLHAFDLDTIPNGEIVVRQAKPGEMLVTLDGSKHELPAGTLCICDKDRAISIAGVMGGQDTEITEMTTNVLLETAHFDPFCIRRTAKKVVRSEASYRFERYVDPNLVAIAAARAARLIVEICGGEIVGVVETVAQPIPKTRVLARMDRIWQILGADVDRDAAIGALERLGVSVMRSAGSLDCLIPPWRPDLTIEEDIAEEVGRLALGYANLPETMPPLRAGGASDSPRGRFRTQVCEALVGMGLQEVITHSLVGPAPYGTEADDAHRAKLSAPMSPEFSTLRLSLLPAHFTIAAEALRSGQRDMAFFEIGAIYRKDGDTFSEPFRVSGLAAGSAMPAAWSLRMDALPADFYYAKGIVEQLCAALGLAPTFTATSTHPLAHPYRTASVLVDNTPVGTVGELSEKTITDCDLPKRSVFFDLDGDALMRLSEEARSRYRTIANRPSAVRDLAPVLAKSVAYGTVETAAQAALSPLCESFRLVDVYEGANVGEGNRSLTLRLTFRAPDRTLTNEEVDTELARVREAIEAVGGVFRG